MTNNPTIDGVSRDLLERATDNKYIDKERISIYRHEALCGIRALLAAPAGERQPIKNASEVAYNLQAENAALQSTNTRLTETIQHMIDQTIPLVPDENNQMWSRRITVDELQSTIAQLQARIVELESARGKVVAWRFKERPDDMRSQWLYTEKLKRVPPGHPFQTLRLETVADGKVRDV